jgi:sterol O-acyltransferase
MSSIKTNSSDKIEDLINTLNSLKNEKDKRREENAKGISIIEQEKEKLSESSQKIIKYLNLIQEELKTCEQSKQNIADCGNIQPEKKKKEESLIKKFISRESHLTELMKKDSYQTIYNIFMSLLMILTGIHVSSYYIETHNLFNFNFFIDCLQGTYTNFIFFFSKIGISVFFIIFIHIVKDIYQKGNKPFAWFLFYSSYIALFYSYKYLFDTQGMSLLIKLIHHFNNVTMLCKIYAYYCEKVVKVSYILSKDENGENGHDDKNLGHGMSLILKDEESYDKVHFEFKKVNLFKEIKNFIYFYFAPTLIYRDVYPMRNNINFKEAFKHIIHMMLSFVFSVLLFETNINHNFSEAKLTLHKFDTLVQVLVGFIICSIILLFIIFFGMAHSYLGFYAEITKFDDRHFYDDFYSAKNPIKFYSKLTLYYEDFLDAYFKPFFSEYKRMYSLVRLAFYCIMSEYAFLSSTGLYCPFISFVIIFSHIISFPLSLLKTQKKVLFNWMIVSLGMGLLVMVNYIEFVISESQEWSHNNTRFMRKALPKIWYIITGNFY